MVKVRNLKKEVGECLDDGNFNRNDTNDIFIIGAFEKLSWF